MDLQWPHGMSLDPQLVIWWPCNPCWGHGVLGMMKKPMKTWYPWWRPWCPCKGRGAPVFVCDGWLWSYMEIWWRSFWRDPQTHKMVEEGHEAHAPDKCHLMKTLMPFKVLEAFACWTLLMIWKTQLMTRAMTYNNLRVSNPWIWLSHEDHASVDKVHQGEALEALEDCLEFLFWWSPWFMENHGWND